LAPYALIAYNQVRVLGITARGIVQVDLDPFQFKFILEDFGGGLFFRIGMTTAATLMPYHFKSSMLFKTSHIVGNAQNRP
jgi:hypothetical protein